MKQIKNTFWSRQIAFGLYGVLIISIFFLHGIEDTYSSMNKGVDSIMAHNLPDKQISELAIVIPSKKPVKGQFDLAQM